MNQIDMFDILSEEQVVDLAFAKGDTVLVKTLKQVTEERGQLEPEDEYFFQTFGGQRGIVNDTFVGSITKAISYRVTLKNDKVVWCNAGDMLYV
ncbi:hypothetical protein ABE236_18230 [Priestia endophytica]|uniref:hypothetical protein n=1 Tax=Priestia endophytica TaxID=135735 RepID=UPI003D282B72